jgi:hypothetical protein
MSQAPPAAPRRDVLGFFKAIVEFFTGTTRVAAAGLGLLGTVITLALVAPTDNPGPERTGPGPVLTEPPVVDPPVADPGPAVCDNAERLARGEWVSNDPC